jgi:hypothetical protein
MLTFLESFSFYDPNHEFLYGIGFAILLVCLIKLLIWLLTSRKCVGINLEGDKGNLFITSGAIEDFVIRTLADREEMVIDKVKLKRKGSSYLVILFLRVSAETNVNELRLLIEERVLAQTVNRIGIDSIKEVNIILKNFSAKEKQIKSRHKLAMKEYTEEENDVLPEEAPKAF